MSRTHLYKLLDRGEIVFHRVGRDRRELAERFAHQRQTALGATDEIADLI